MCYYYYYLLKLLLLLFHYFKILPLLVSVYKKNGHNSRKSAVGAFEYRLLQLGTLE